MSDAELLNEYGASASRGALDQLVKRHIDFVYYAALRQVRDVHMAEDVTQAVFIILTRKARSIRAGFLMGWLFNTTRYAARNAMRMEKRRRHYEQQAARTESDAAGSADATWDSISPDLDAALAHLGRADREAVLLRYFKGLSIREVAQSTGVSEVATQKRINRAIHKLRADLAQAAPALTAASMSDVLTRHAIGSAPAHLSGAVITSATAASLPATTLGLVKGTLAMMTWTEIKFATAIAATVLLAGSAGALALSQMKTAAAPVATSSAIESADSAPSADPNFPELVGLRLRKVVKVTMGQGPADADQSVAEQSFVTFEWSVDAAAAQKVASFTISVFRSSGDANVDLPDASKRVWQCTLNDSKRRWVNFGFDPAPGHNGPAHAPWSLSPGEYWVVMSADDARQKQILSAEGLARIIVEPLRYSQIEIDELQLDGSIKSHSIQQSINQAPAPLNKLSFINSDFVNVTSMSDDEGKPIRFTARHDTHQHIYQYTAILNKPVPQGEALLMASDTSMKGLIRNVGDNEFEYRFAHSPGSNETRCFRRYRLPARATLVSVSPANLPSRVKDGRVEVALDRLVPPGGNISTVIRYKVGK